LIKKKVYYWYMKNGEYWNLILKNIENGNENEIKTKISKIWNFEILFL